MASTTSMTTAKIYEFPVKRRAEAPAYSGARSQVSDLRAPPLARMDFGSAWYHEAAMQEEAAPWKRDGH